MISLLSRLSTKIDEELHLISFPDWYTKEQILNVLIKEAYAFEFTPPDLNLAINNMLNNLDFWYKYGTSYVNNPNNQIYVEFCFSITDD